MVKETIALSRRKELVILLALICTGAALRFFFIGREGLWFDETLTALSLRMPFFEMVRERLAAGHSPLYFIILYPYAKLFGTGELAVRLPSTAASIVSIYVFWLVAKRLFTDYRTVVFSSSLFVLSAVSIYFGQEARMYSFSVLFMLLSFYLLLRALDENRLNLWIFYVISTSAAFNMSSSAIPLIFAQIAFVLIKRRNAVQYLVALLSIVVLYLPMGIFYLRMRRFAFIEWLPPVTGKVILEIFYGFGFRPLPGMKETWIPSFATTALEGLSIYFIGALILWGLVSSFITVSEKRVDNGKEKDTALLLILWLAVPLILEYIYSVVRQPMLGPKRYVITLSPAYYLLIGLGVKRIGMKKLRGALATMVIALFSFALAGYYSAPKREDWRGSIAYIDERLEPGEVMFGNLSTQTLYRYYGKTSDLIILDIRYINTKSFVKGWILLRDMDHRVWAGEIETLKEGHSLLLLDDYKGIRLYHFER